MALETLVAGSVAAVAPLNSNFTYLDGRITTLNSTVSTNSTNILAIQNNIASLQLPTVITFSGTTSPVLTDNSEHKITIIGNTEFTVPTITTSTNFHQMLVFVNMPTVYSLDLGTDGNYFYGAEPDMSQAGEYTVIYEYDGSDWYAGAIYRGSVSE